MIKRFINDLKKYYRYSIVAAKSQLKSEVANSYLNWIWWILDPLCFMVIYTFIFGYVFDAKELYFPIFIFIGLSIWDFFNKSLVQSVKIIKHNKSIISKVYFPKFILLLIRVWVNGFKMMISFGIVILMMIGYRISLSWNVLFFFPIVITLGVFTFGCGCFLLHYGVYIEDLSNVTNIVLRFVFYATGIFYNIETRISQWGGLLNQINPVAFLISSMRKCLIYCEIPNLKLLAIWFFVSIIIVIAGLKKIYKEENSYVKTI